MKRLAVQAHLWLGLTLGLFWAVQGLTGAALVFHREIDRWAHPERTGTAVMASLDHLAAAAAAHAGVAPRRISVVDDTPDVLIADFDAPGGEARQLFLDPASGQVVDERAALPSAPGGGATSRFLYNLHERLLSGEVGEALVGLSGFVLMTSLATGLWIGWPRIWRSVVSVRAWRSRPQKLYGWHRLVGLAAGFALLGIVPPGIYMIFAEPVRNAVAAVAPFEPPYMPQSLAGTAPSWIAPQVALDAARARFPDAGFVRVALPGPKTPVYAIRLLQPGEARAWSGTTTIVVDAVTGRVLDVYDPLTAPLANRILDAAFSVHNGEIAGPVGRLLVMLAGLSLPTFYVTGVWLWFARRRRRAVPGAVHAA